jgi:pyrrolidone-carboxylate peptidase
MHILVTGFNNFGSINNNPSKQLVDELSKYYKDQIITYVFECKYDEIDRQLPILLNKYRPGVIIMFGLANRSNVVRIEKKAKLPTRLRSFNFKKLYSSTLPNEKIYTRLKSVNIATKYSTDAGSYYCNYLFYKVCTLTKTNNIHGFIHIPNKNLYYKLAGTELDLFSLGKNIVELFI